MDFLLNEPCALNCTVFGTVVGIGDGITVVQKTLVLPGTHTAAAATGLHCGVGDGLGVGTLVGVGVGVGTGGDPEQIATAIIPLKNWGTVVTGKPPPPPQLNISAAARKDSTGTSTKHRRHQFIKQ
ncbi:MAG: hypothetical protein IVW56_04910 [Candidatus Binataceae bacterium]|nr:hypothetical protein [Candidatus Binataceae bacterium]